MYVARYLLDIEEFMDAENGEALLARAFLRVDEERGEKARRMHLQLHTHEKSSYNKHHGHRKPQ